MDLLHLESDNGLAPASSGDDWGFGAVAKPRARRRRPRRQALSESTGIASAWLISDPNTPVESRFLENLFAMSVDGQPHYTSSPLCVVGVILFQWRLRGVQDTFEDLDLAARHKAVDAQYGRAQKYGYLEYSAIKVCPFDEGIKPCDADDVADLSISSLRWSVDFDCCRFQGRTLMDVCLENKADQPTYGFVVSSILAESLVKDLTRTIHVHPTKAHMQRDKFFPDFPMKGQLNRWRQQVRADAPPAEPDPDIFERESAKKHLLYLPPGLPDDELIVGARTAGRQKHYDPVETIRQLKFAGCLRDQSKTEDALQAAIDAVCPSEALKDEVAAHKPQTPRKSSLYRAGLKLDPVCMNIERRQFKHMHRCCPDVIVSAHIFADGSPVTGLEIQGMVLQLALIQGIFRNIILPGVCLHFGGMSTMDKAIALLWALWLVVGNDLDRLVWILSKVTSITTDMGHELGLLDIPDILHVFVQRMRGRPMDSLVQSVDPKSRLFKVALRISGWSHAWGNIMKHVVKKVDRWPEILYYLRQLVRFFRNRTWRNVIAKRLDGVFPDIKKLMKTFRASFKKWRYETFDAVFFALLQLRALCQTHLRELDQLVPNCQEPELVKDVKIACGLGGIMGIYSGLLRGCFAPLRISSEVGARMQMPLRRKT